MTKKIELTPRLQAVASFVPQGARLADIGTDHAYLPVSLLLDGRIPGAIAADLRPGPLDRARKTAQEYGCTQSVTFRLCDGLSDVKCGETDVISIAGMGGETIADILGAAEWVRENRIPVIMQPMSSQPELRRWLCSNGYDILEEKQVREGDTIYTALSVRAGEMPPMSAAEYCAGKNTADPLRGDWLEHWINRTARALNGMAQARSEQVAQRKAELEEVLSGLQEMKKEWDAWQL